MRYRVLGSLAVGDIGDEVELGPLKHRALLARLLLEPNRVITVDDLVEALWAGGPPATAVKTLQVYISQLRRRLGPDEIERHPAGYLIRVGADDLDSEVFERFLSDGRAAAGRGNRQLAGALLDRGLALWRGPALSDIRYADFASAEARRLEDLRTECQEERLAVELDLGRHVESLRELRALVEQHPLRERLRRLEILALYRSGRQVEALERFRNYRQALADELGLEPGPEITALNGAILRQEPELLAGPAADRVDRIPSPPTRLIGRESELDSLARLLGEPSVRLVSLVGAGGSGKTRLAFALADLRRGDFANGVVVVELAAVTGDDFVVTAIADAVDRSGADESELADWLSGRELLLVADNAEHLPTVGPLLVRLLTRAPRLKVAVTSRAVLHVSGEHVFLVQPLREDEAVELFAVRARALEPRLHLGPTAMATAREICRRLDCLPLAVELAAAQTRTLGLKPLLELMTESVSSIGGSLRDLPARQQTLHAALSWSSGLLAPSVLRAFAPLGVFVGGMSLEAAVAVSASGCREIEALVDNSLLTRAAESEDDETPRYSMLETVREHALELLADDTAVVEERHARFYLGVAESVAAALPSPDQRALMRLLQAEDGNLRRALQTFVARQSTHDQLRLCAALWRYWWVRGRLTEGRANLEAALVAPDHERRDPARLAVLRGAAILADRQADHVRSVALAGEQRAIASELGDPEMEASALNILASAAVAGGDAASAVDLTRRAVELLSGTERDRDRAFALINLGNAELNRGDFEACKTASLESARLMDALGDGLQAATPLYNAGLASLELGDVDGAADRLHASFERICGLEHTEYIANGLDALAALGVAQGVLEAAALRHGAAGAIRRDADSTAEAYEAGLRARTARAITDAVGSERMSELVEAGASEPWRVVVAALADSQDEDAPRSAEPSLGESDGTRTSGLPARSG